jgi:hypothetical protein
MELGAFDILSWLRLYKTRLHNGLDHLHPQRTANYDMICSLRRSNWLKLFSRRLVPSDLWCGQNKVGARTKIVDLPLRSSTFLDDHKS